MRIRSARTRSALAAGLAVLLLTGGAGGALAADEPTPEVPGAEVPEVEVPEVETAAEQPSEPRRAGETDVRE